MFPLDRLTEQLAKQHHRHPIGMDILCALKELSEFRMTLVKVQAVQVMVGEDRLGTRLNLFPQNTVEIVTG